LSESSGFLFEKFPISKNSYISFHSLQLTPTSCEVFKNGKASGFSLANVSVALACFLDPLVGYITPVTIIQRKNQI
jgi:hypothetical protein